MIDRFKFRAYDETYKRFLYRTLIDSKEASLMWEQCTGLKDKNGHLIYEGDIVKDEEGFIGLIKYDEVGAMFKIEFVYSAPSNFEDDMSWEFEVIGNIHEKPELLKEES